MPKLQKRSPPAYPGFGTNTTSLEEGGIRYESLPQDTRQPVPLNESYHQVAVSGALASRYSTPPVQQDPATRAISQQFSPPVSPLMDAPERNRVSLPPPQIHAPQPQRKSVELRRLNGTPYETERPKQVKVAQDMHEGVDPPAYKRQNSIPPPLERPVIPAAGSRPGSAHHDCSKCGKKRTTTTGNLDSRPGTSYSAVSVIPAHNCGNCGKRKTSTPASPSTSGPQPRVVSQSVPLMPQPYVASPAAASSRGMPQANSPTVAGPSSGPTPYPPSSFPGAAHARPCHKCGKKKKPAIAPLPQGTFASTYPTAPSSAPLNRPQQAGLSIMSSSNMPRGPQIDIVPPSTTTYRPTSLQSANTWADNAPLINNRHSRPISGGIFRNNSLVRSLSRRMSGRNKRESQGPLPSQQLRASQNDAGAGNLINMISNAIKESGPEKMGSKEYQKLGVGDRVERPASPFSFMSASKEDDGFEMVDMQDEKEKVRDSGSTAVASSGSPKGRSNDDAKSPQSLESIYSPVAIAETMDQDVDRRSRDMRRSADRKQDADMLGAPQYGVGSRPPITRFKSLREGVSRAASVSRQSSLKRLGSLKKVHTNWYRDDMAIEGHNGESVAVF